MKKVLFLCSGNYYRSRFAEILFNSHARQRELAWIADSRGLALDGCNPGPISRHTVQYLAARGILSQASGRLPLAVKDIDFATAEHVVAVKEAEHRPLVEARFSKWRDRVEYWQVHDLDCALPDEAIPLLEQLVLQLLERLAKQAA